MKNLSPENPLKPYQVEAVKLFCKVKTLELVQAPQKNQILSWQCGIELATEVVCLSEYCQQMVETTNNLRSDNHELGRELMDARCRLAAVSDVIKAHGLHLTEQAHKAFAEALSR